MDLIWRIKFLSKLCNDRYSSRLITKNVVELDNFCLLGQNMFNENETIAKYEIMDGAPVRGKNCE